MCEKDRLAFAADATKRLMSRSIKNKDEDTTSRTPIPSVPGFTREFGEKNLPILMSLTAVKKMERKHSFSARQNVKMVNPPPQSFFLTLVEVLCERGIVEADFHRTLKLFAAHTQLAGPLLRVRALPLRALPRLPGPVPHLLLRRVALARLHDGQD